MKPVTEQRIAVPGTSNLRDVGGYRVADGAVIARRRLYRAEAIVDPGGPSSYSFYDAEHDAHYRSLEVRTVIDLRAEAEFTRAPSAWASATGGTLHQLPIAEGGEGADTNFFQMLLTGELTAFDATDMGRFYVALLEQRADVLGAAYRLLADRSALPVLVHCAAGKDRTGVFVALVLRSLGVAEEVVVQDYALTGVLRPNRVDASADRIVAAGRDPEIARVLFDAPAEAMRFALAHLTERYGDAAHYLTDRAGVSAADLAAVRLNLLERPD
ncbi:tyrosine-protein phosphatase [Gordonia rubripertincta]|nr:tyrosine-protein phosphatase [Gordonia rubripertincta]